MTAFIDEHRDTYGVEPSLVCGPCLRRMRGTARVDVDHEGDVDEALPGRNVSEVCDPQLIRPLGTEMPIDLVLRARLRLVADRGARALAADDAGKAQPAHQPLDRAPRHAIALSHQLTPDLARAVNAEVLFPDTSDLDA